MASRDQKIGIAKLVAGGILAVGIVIYMILTAGSRELVLLGFAGGLAGWIAGIFLSPKTKGEAEEFSEYRAGIATFLGGITVAEIRNYVASAPMPLVGVLYFLIPAGIGFLFTWYGRRIKL